MATTTHAQETDQETQPPLNTIVSTLSDFGHEDLRLQGLYGTNSVWIPFQSDWAVQGNILLELNYMGSPLLNEDTAIVTVLVNGKPITSFRPAGDGLQHTAMVSIPYTEGMEAGFHLGFNGHLRLTDDACEDSFNIGQWLMVQNTSEFTIYLADTPPAPELTDLPQALVVQGSETPSPIIFVLPNNVDDLTLSVAAQVASRLGSAVSTSHLPIQVATADSLTEEAQANANLIIVGVPEEQALLEGLGSYMPIPPADDGFVSQDNVLIPDSDGVVQIFASPWNPNRNILVVSGNAKEGLAMAGQGLADEDTSQSLTGSFHFIHSLVERPESVEPPPWLTAQTTFSQLGESDHVAMGLGINTINYFFRYPSGTVFNDKGEIVLHVAFSSALRDEGSYVEVYVNDIYIGAIDAATAGGDAWVSMELPTNALNELARKGRQRELDIKLSISNALPTNNCDPINAESSWTKVYADSYFDLETIPADLPDLYYFPYPFVYLDNPNPVRIVLPDVPNEKELQTTFTTSALLGNQLLTNLAIDVVKARVVVSDLYKDSNLILIGTTEDNPVLDEAIANFETNTSSEVYQTLEESQIGFFHQLASPWNEELNALAIYGETDAGFEAAADALNKQGWLANESGSIAMVRPGEESVIIYRETGVPQPRIIQPEVVVSEISPPQQTMTNTTTAVDPNTTEIVATPTSTDPVTEASLSNIERLILVITAFLVILVTIAALLRIAWRLRA